MKYLNNYADEAAYNADTRPTDSSVVSNIETVGVRYDGKNVFVPKESADVGDIVVIDNGELRYIKLDTYDAALTTVEPIGVVYYRTGGEIRVVYKNSLGNVQWAAPMRVKVEGFDLINGGTHTITVNSSTYNFTYLAGATLSDVSAAILAALPTGTGWSVETKDGYIVIQRSYYTPSISSFDVSDLTVTILNADYQAQYTGFLTAYLNFMRENGYSHNYAGANYERFLQYYEVSGSNATGVDQSVNAVVRRSVFNEVDNPLLVSAYGTYENYILDNLVKMPYSKDAIADNDGKSNTEKLISYTYIDDDGVEKPSFPAAHAASSVSAGNVTWWLPSAEEMSVLARDVKLDYSDPLSRALYKIGDRFAITSTHWTSSERNSYNSWVYNGSYGYMRYNGKNTSNVVRAVSAFYF
ncbi:MAG: hypothetical protein BWY95_01462 [Bacteroidetes bacterium ADurb.BinA104]|nr:MAG: hypothetical protein BWY95_01462 [Bacteroidetes bacterium ADurb.BinA104]